MTENSNNQTISEKGKMNLPIPDEKYEDGPFSFRSYNDSGNSYEYYDQESQDDLNGGTHITGNMTSTSLY